MATIQNQSEEDFAEAENKFALQKLKTVLEELKGSRITPAPWRYFKGVLCGHEPKEIATKCGVSRETVEISLNRNIKDELLKLLEFDNNTRIDWSSIPKWLERTEYKIQPIEERLLTSINQLGSENIQVRICAIHVLERIAEDSPKDHWRIMEILTKFVRVNAPRKEEEEKHSPSILIDIQTALTIIGRRNSNKYLPNHTLVLSDTDIRGAELSGTNLQGADLRRCNLQGTNLCGANLQGVYLYQADLKGRTYLREANLQGANLYRADLQGTYLWGANLQGAFLLEAKLEVAFLIKANLQAADFWGANLKRADLREANLQYANFRQAQLQGVDFSGANLKGANLIAAELQGAKLNRAINLESWQIKSAYGDSTTVLPDNVEAPPHWTQAG